MLRMASGGIAPHSLLSIFMNGHTSQFNALKYLDSKEKADLRAEILCMMASRSEPGVGCV